MKMYLSVDISLLILAYDPCPLGFLDMWTVAILVFVRSQTSCRKQLNAPGDSGHDIESPQRPYDKVVCTRAPKGLLVLMIETCITQ